MAATIKIKNSSTTGAVPTSSDLVQGELAVNVTDLGLYTENASGTVVKLNAPSIDDKNTGATKHLTISTGGNLGLGVTPKAWASGKAIEHGFSGSAEWGFTQTSTYRTTNAYYDGAWKYGGTGAAAMYVQLDGAHNWQTATSGTAGASLGWTQAMTLDASGNLGIGTTSPNAHLEVSGSGAQFLRASSSTNTSFRGFEVGVAGSSTSYGYLAMNIDSGEMRLVSGYSGYGGFQTFYANGSERARIDSSGNLLVGITSSGAGHLFKYVGSSGYITQFLNGSGTGIAQFEIGATAGTPAISGTLRISKDAGSNRSINAAGTVNQNGADYAEYMTKCGDFTVSKGDVVGINAEGKLTNVFADAISFAVKSTDPGLVGGDNWFNEQRPVDENGVECLRESEEFQAWLGRLEVARAKVDRIAFAGQVPVNVMGAMAGQYIIPVNDNGAIKGEAVSNPTFEQYQQAVGKVIAIEQDGRARIIVKVA